MGPQNAGFLLIQHLCTQQVQQQQPGLGVSPPVSGTESHQAPLLMEPAGSGPDSQEERTESQASSGRLENPTLL